MNIPAFVINLDRDQHKLAAVGSRLDQVGIPFERLPAVDGRSLSLQEKTEACSTACASFCPAAAIGCFLSHRKAWQTIVDRALPLAYVFEDDVAFHDGARELIDLSFSELPQDFHVNLLGCFTCQQEMLVESLIGMVRRVSSGQPYSEHLRIPSQTFGSQAYLVSQTGAKTLLSTMSKMSATVDWQMGDAMKRGLKLFTTVPDATYQTDMDQSSIATRAPALLNTVMQKVPADRYRSVAWILSVPLFSFANLTFSAWCMLIGVLTACCPIFTACLLIVDTVVSAIWLKTKIKDYLPLFLSAIVGMFVGSFVVRR